MILDQIHFIIVEPQTPGNIGSICRACTNMGVKNLILVNPVEYLVDDTFRFGWGSEELIRRIRVVQHLSEIAGEMNILIGTTNRKRENQWPIYSPKDIAVELNCYLTPSTKIGILFGRENNGLTNEELALCNYHSTIPSATEYPAVNLSQAVMVYAYELFQTLHSTPQYHWNLATKLEQERLFELIGESVETLPFKTRNGTTAFVNLFRRVLGRTKLESRDVRVLYKLFGLIKKK